MDFSETIVVCDLKLATDDRSDRKFLLTWNLCPLGAVCLLPRGYIQVLNHGKNTCMNKIRLQRYFFETCIKWVKWEGLSVDIKILSPKILSPGGCLPLPRGYIHVLKHEKMYKIRLQSHFFKFGTDDFFNHATNDRSDKMFLLTSNFSPQGVVSSYPWAIYMYKNLKKSDLKDFF